MIDNSICLSVFLFLPFVLNELHLSLYLYTASGFHPALRLGSVHLFCILFSYPQNLKWGCKNSPFSSVSTQRTELCALCRFIYSLYKMQGYTRVSICFAISPTVLFLMKSAAVSSMPKVLLISVTIHIVSKELIPRSNLKLSSALISSAST